MGRPCERRDGYAPIGDYAVIGDKRTAALVAADGAIDWFSPGAFDRPSAFGALLDARRGGAATLRPAVPFTVQRRYRPATNVLETTFETEQGTMRVTDAMSLPIARALSYSQILRRVDGLAGEVPLTWRVEPRFDYGSRTARIARRDGTPYFVDGVEVLAVQAHGLGDVRERQGVVEGACRCAAGDVGILALSCFNDGPVDLSGRDGLLDRLETTAEHWGRWAQGFAYDGPWRDAVLRGALALDLLIDDGTSAVVAAPTMALPERLGGPRNYDYRYSWLRDGNLTLEAMLRLGFGEQVHASLAWMLAAIEHTHPWLQPIYRIDGRPRLPDRELPLDGYAGSRPVTLGNSAEGQLQLSGYGDVFDMLWHYVEAGNALAGEAGRRVAELADYVCRVWDRPDAGLWELGEDRQYTQSKLACWLALKRAVQLADAGQIPSRTAGGWRSAIQQIRRFVGDRCWDERRGAYRWAADAGDRLDAGVLLAGRATLADDDPGRLAGTLDAVLDELGAGDGLLYRYSGMDGEEGAFLACSFWAAETCARLDRHDQAGELMDVMLGHANDVGLFSEELDPDSGELRGNMPLALTHLSLINAAHVCRDRAAGSPTP